MSLIDIEAAAEPVDFDYFANPLVKKNYKGKWVPAYSKRK